MLSCPLFYSFFEQFIYLFIFREEGRERERESRGGGAAEEGGNLKQTPPLRAEPGPLRPLQGSIPQP